MSRLNEGALVAPHPLKARNVGIFIYSDTSFGEVERQLAIMLFPTHKIYLKCNRPIKNVAKNMHVFYHFFLFIYTCTRCVHMNRGPKNRLLTKEEQKGVGGGR